MWLTNWQMQSIGGTELIDPIGATDSPPPTILLTTQFGGTRARARALFTGADKYWVKPVGGASLQRGVEVMRLRPRQPSRMVRAPLGPATAHRCKDLLQWW